MSIRIGITTSYNEGEQRLTHAYVTAVERAGGLPLIVPMLEDPKNVDEFVHLLDGLVITGGPAITDGLIGKLPDDIQETDAVRVESDRTVLAAFMRKRKPILGICYGMQLINATVGGTIYADVQAQIPGTLSHSEKRGADSHSILLEETSYLRRLLKNSSLEVNTRHIQAVAEVGPPCRIAARAPDGVIEAIEDEDGTILGVQFQPERMGEEMLPLFQHLIANARKVAEDSAYGT